MSIGWVFVSVRRGGELEHGYEFGEVVKEEI